MTAASKKKPLFDLFKFLLQIFSLLGNFTDFSLLEYHFMFNFKESTSQAFLLRFPASDITPKLNNTRKSSGIKGKFCAKTG